MKAQRRILIRRDVILFAKMHSDSASLSHKQLPALDSALHSHAIGLSHVTQCEARLPSGRKVSVR